MRDFEIQEIKPISFKERVEEIDILRGFALFGVLLVNMAMFNTTLFSKFASAAPLSNPLQLETFPDKLAALFIQIFAEGKFYTIFSMLFGLGFYIFMERAEEKEISPNRLFMRRSFFLLLFGILHFNLVWYGDILHVYGLIGFLLMAFRKRSLKIIRIWIVILLILSTLLYSGFVFLNSFIEASFTPETLEAQYNVVNALMKESIEVYKNGSYIDIIRYRFYNEFSLVLMNLVVLIPKILGMFLIGLYAGKKGIFKDIEGNLHIIEKVWRRGGIIGILSTIAYILLQWYIISINPLLREAAVTIFKEIATVFLSLFYAASLLLLLRKPSFSNKLAPLRYIGQMALTNYLVQCISCSILFYGYGLGLLNEVGLAAGVIFTVLIYGAQLIVSKKWLQRFRYGPFEWLWRKLTYKGL